MADRLQVVYAGKVVGNQLITGPTTSIPIKGDYNGKEGFFSIKDGIVYRYVYFPNIFDWLRNKGEL